MEFLCAQISIVGYSTQHFLVFKLGIVRIAIGLVCIHQSPQKAEPQQLFTSKLANLKYLCSTTLRSALLSLHLCAYLVWYLQHLGLGGKRGIDILIIMEQARIHGTQILCTRWPMHCPVPPKMETLHAWVPLVQGKWGTPACSQEYEDYLYGMKTMITGIQGSPVFPKVGGPSV